MFAEQNGYRVCLKQDGTLVFFFKIWIGELKAGCIFLSFQVFFVESVCEDPEVIAQNIVVSFVSFH